MSGSTPIATIRGIPIRVHFTLYIAFVLFVVQFGLAGIPLGVLLFASVLAHELGHAFVAQRLGVGIAAIDLHLLGGAALMTDNPDEPSDEVKIAAAGPAVSFALGFGFGLLAWLAGSALNLTSPGMGNLLAYGAAINIGMGVFNLVPAFPMDGGRILRAAMASRLGDVRATRIASIVARVFAVLFVGFGLFGGGLSLALIGGFVFVLAGREEKMSQAREAVRRARAERLGPPLFWHQRLAPIVVRREVIDTRQRPFPSWS